VGALPRDYYHHDPDRHSLVGRATGRAFHLGDAMTVRLEEADAITGTLAFGFVAHTPAGRSAQRPRHAPPSRPFRKSRRRH
jgi:ribonuclease R